MSQLTPDNQRLLDAALAAVSKAGKQAEHHSYRGDATVIVASDVLLPLVRTLRDSVDSALDMLIDCTAVDYMAQQSRGDCKHRFEVVYHFASSNLPVGTWEQRAAMRIHRGNISAHPSSTVHVCLLYLF